MTKYINADKFAKHLENCICEVKNTNGNPTEYEIVLRALKNAPAANVAEVVRGQWINPHWKNSDYCCNCSVCKEEAIQPEYRWHDKGIYPICPNCGARMMEVRRNNE